MKKAILMVLALMIVLLASCNKNPTEESSLPETENSFSETSKKDETSYLEESEVSGSFSKDDKEWTTTTFEGDTKKVQEYTNYGNDWKTTIEKFKNDIVISREVIVIENKEIVRTEKYTFDETGFMIEKNVEGKSEDGEGKTNIYEWVEDGIRRYHISKFDDADNEIYGKSVYSYVDGDVMIQEKETTQVTFLDSKCEKNATVFYKGGEKLGTEIVYDKFENKDIKYAKAYTYADDSMMYDEVVYSDNSIDANVYLENSILFGKQKSKTDFSFYIVDPDSDKEQYVCDTIYNPASKEYETITPFNDFSKEDAIEVINKFFTRTTELVEHFKDHDKAPIV
ncbi:MAG: hypothetical protein IJB49_00960 [Clostridia bacterium]|nr:hypothetical protein [Clostridia bacterium]